MADTRDYRSVAYRQALLDQMNGGQYQQMEGTAPYTMAPPSYASGGMVDPLGEYERRNEGAGGFGRGAAGGAAMGATVGSMAPGVGTLFGAGVGALAGGIGGAFTKNAKTAMTDFSANDARDAIQKQYQSAYGRAPGAAEVEEMLRGQGFRADQGHQWVGESGLRSVLDSIQSNARQQPVSNPTQSPMGGAASGVASPAGLPTAGNSGFSGGSGAMVDPYALPEEQSLESLLANAQRYGGYDASTGRMGAAGAASGAGGYQYAGFDFGQDPGNRDIGKSAKYAFSQFAEDAARAGAPQPRTKAEAESWFNQYIAPRMQQAGYAIEWVKGDKARVATREGVDEIDFLINADGDNPTLGWQSELLAPGPSMAAGAQGGGATGSLPTSGMDLSSSALFDQLLQQARDIAAGKSQGASVLDTEALLQLLSR